MLWWRELSVFLTVLIVYNGEAQNLEENGTRNSIDNGGGSCTKNKFIEPFDLPPNYPHYEFPITRNQKTCQFEQIPVTIGLRIQNIRTIVDTSEEVSMEIDLITSWKDDYLAEALVNKTEEILDEERDSTYIALESSFLDKIWQPNIIFSRVISITRPSTLASQIQNDPSRLRVFPSGFVELYSRLVVTLYCPMDFKYFPFDTQTCDVDLRSYAFSNKDIELTWRKVPKYENSNVTEAKELVYFFNRGHPNYLIHLHGVNESARVELDSLNERENYTHLQFSLSFKRKLTHHLVQSFIPITFLVSITWLTFFIPLSNLEARIAVAMTTLLTMTSKQAEVASSAPNVSYVTAMDIYMFFSIAIVFFTLFEFTILYWIRKGRSEYAESRVSLKKKLPPPNAIGRGGTELEESARKVDNRVYLKVRNYVEVYGFLLTIVAFAGFKIWFWPWMLIRTNYFGDNVDLDYNEPLP